MGFYPAKVFAPLLAFSLILLGCQDEIASPEMTSEEAATPTTQKAHPPADQATLSQQLNMVRGATKKYRDIETARNNGYVAVSPYVPGMGFHFAAGPPFGTELENPGVLVYYTNGSYNPEPGEFHDSAHDDDLILGAVEWLVKGDQEDNPPDIFDDEKSPRNLKTTEEEGWHYEEHGDFTGLHAWVHRGNPEGVFHGTNPNID